jgi:hypothetical protein
MGTARGNSSVTGPAGQQAEPRGGTFFWAILLVLLLLAAGAALLFRGREYYALDLITRLDHPDNDLLAPGKPIGHAYGVIGTTLIMTNLLYLVRRRLARFRLGSMRAWLNLHVTTGLVGGLLVIFHSAFQLRTPIATTTMVALFVVLLTGVFGRYIYSLTPTPDTERFESHLRVFDSVGPGMGKVIRERLAQVPPSKPRRASLLFLVFTIPAWIREAKLRRNVVLGTAAEYELRHLTEVRLLLARVADCADIAAAEVRSAAAAALLRSWRGFHRLSALLLLALVTVHIATAWYMGYRWIFSTQ